MESRKKVAVKKNTLSSKDEFDDKFIKMLESRENPFSILPIPQNVVIRSKYRKTAKERQTTSAPILPLKSSKTLGSLWSKLW